MQELLTILIFLYASTGIIAIIAYLPTIKDLLKGIPSANIDSYFIWSFTSFVSFMYAIFIISDLLLEIVTGLGFVSCTTILALSLGLKYKK